MRTDVSTHPQVTDVRKHGEATATAAADTATANAAAPAAAPEEARERTIFLYFSQESLDFGFKNRWGREV